MSCWIDAPDKVAALAWGYVLLGDYYQARFAQSPARDRYTGEPVRDGSLVEPGDALYDMFEGTEHECAVGEIPEWHEPWRIR